MAMLFVAITSLPAQLSEQTLQHFPYGNLRHAEPTSDGYLLAFSPNPWGGTVVIQKIDLQGKEVWQYKLNSSGWFNYNIMDMLVLDNDECILSVNLVWGVFCPDFSDMNIHLSADGQVLSYTGSLSYNGASPSGLVQTLSEQEANPFLVYSVVKYPLYYGGGAIYLVDTSSMGHSLTAYYHLNSSLPDFFFKDTRGRFLVPVPQGIGIFDPVAYTISDSLYLGTSHVQAVTNAPDSTLLVVHHESIVRINMEGEVLDTRHYPGSKLWKAQYVGDNLYLLDHKNKANELLWILNRETMEVIDVLSSFTDGTSFGGVLPGDGEHYVWGNERHNGFIKPITFSGEYESVTTDVAMVDFQLENINVSALDPSWMDAIQVEFKDIKVNIQNTGQETVNEVIINLPVDLNTTLQISMNNPLPFPKVQVRVEDIQLLPGQSTWLDAGDLTFIGHKMPAGSLLSFEYCLELSSPNNRIDASDANDKLCKIYNHLISSNEEIGTSRAISAWPNPFTDQLQLEGLPEGSHRLSLVDVLGREQAQIQLNGSPSATIDLPPGYGGFYTLILKDSSGQVHTTIPLFRSK